jgi:hypothetical protein
MRIVSIDVGCKNLALVGVTVDDLDLSVRDVTFLARINLMNKGTCRERDCDACKRPTVCRIRKTAMDGLYHVLRAYKSEFSLADVVLIEKQPMQGLLDVEAALYMAFIHKAVLVMPRSVHKFLGIGDLPYESRKVSTEAYARGMLECSQKMAAKFESLGRKHDVADALCFVAFFLDRCRLTKNRNRPNPFQQFAYKSDFKVAQVLLAASEDAGEEVLAQRLPDCQPPPC